MLRQKIKGFGISHRPRENGIAKTDTNIRRLVSKDGEYQVSLEKIGCREKFRRYIRDHFTTFINLKWRWTLLLIISVFFFTWSVFAAFYYLFGWINGDMEAEDLPVHERCVTNVYSYTTALLFSVESQHTIGYGSRAVTEKCPHVITAVFFQFIIGVGMQCLIAGLFFAKFQRAKKRSETTMFSTMACISMFNGQLYLSVRVGNLRSSLLLNVRAMGMLVKKRITSDGDEIPLTQHHIDFYTEGQSDSINLLWPAIIYHAIDEHSPLYNCNHTEILSGYSELIVVLEGVMDSTSKTFQARTSYLPPEVLFNYRFKSISPTMNSDNLFQISYFDFNMVIPTEVKPKRVLLLRDSCSQTVNTGDVIRPLVDELRYWRSLEDVRLSRGESVSIDSNDDVISRGHGRPIFRFSDGGETDRPYNSGSNGIVQSDNFRFQENNPSYNRISNNPDPNAGVLPNHTSVSIQADVTDSEDTENTSILKRTPSGSKIFKVLKLSSEEII